MNRQELLHTHGLLSRIRYYFEYECDDLEVPEGAFDEYNEVGTTAINLDDEKHEHKAAIKALSQSLERLCTPSVDDYSSESASAAEADAKPADQPTTTADEQPDGETPDNQMPDLENLVAGAGNPDQDSVEAPAVETEDNSLAEYGINIGGSEEETASPYGEQQDGEVTAAGEAEPTATTNNLWEYAGEPAPDEPGTSSSDQTDQGGNSGSTQEDMSLGDFADA